MYVYYAFIILVFFISILSVLYPNYKVNNEERLPNIFFTTIILIAFILLYTYRWCNGTDFYNYYLDFMKMKYMTYQNVLETRDLFFTFLTYYMYKAFPDNFIIYNMLLGIITYLPIMIIMRKYSKNFIVSILLYIFMMLYFLPYNTVRQGIACSICFYASRYLMEEKIEYKKFLIWSFIASMFHTTALMFIPIGILSKRRFLKKEIIIAVFILLIIALNLDKIWVYLIKFLRIIGQTKIANDYQYALIEAGGVSYIRILVMFIPVILSCICHRSIKSKFNDNRIDVLMNLSLFSAVFMIFALKFSVLARISQYFEIYNILLYTYILRVFEDKARRVITYVIMVSYFLYMCILIPNGGNLVPYQYYYNFEGQWMINVNLEELIK